MTDYLIDGEILGDIADAIREKTGSDDPITPENMASEIASITGGNKITDLKDTTWYIPSGWLVDAGYGEFEVDFNVTVHDTGTTNLSMQRLHLGYTEVIPMALEGGGQFVELAPIDNNIIVSQIGFIGYREISNIYAFTVTFTGGNAVTNTNLINWLDTYGELQVEEPEIDLSAYQTKIDENLTTRSKEIVGAINAVNQNVTDAMSELQLIRDGYEKVGHAETADKLAGQANLETESKEVIGAINELNSKVGNGTGGSSFEMPQIRFASAIYTNTDKIVDADNPLTLTVEIVGGGALQEGDKLQICVRRTYGYKRNDMPYRKQKLRAVCTYDITNEDIDKRFISISTNDLVNSWLFYNDRNRNDGNTLSAIYLRIKRVSKYNGDGVECDAIFSNVVTVWKTYNPSTNEVSIK